MVNGHETSVCVCLICLSVGLVKQLSMNIREIFSEDHVELAAQSSQMLV